MKRLAKWLTAAALLYAVFLGLVYAMMRSDPATFNQFMAKLPMPVMMAVPFRTLWFHARAGTLEPGGEAPDFELRQVGGEKRVRLSSFRGVRPVLLVFGSYT
jgi:hypothetical protein